MKRKTGIAALLAVAGFIAVWRYPAAAAAGISRGLSLCASVIVPSLFPFLVLAGFLIRSGVADAVGRRLERPTRRLFGLPGACAAGIVIGAIGGYPAGAAAVGELVREGSISRADGRRMMRFCVNAGPGFLVGTVGATLLGSPAAGAALFAVQLGVALLMGIIGADRAARHAPPVTLSHKTGGQGIAASLVGAVNDGCGAVLSMSGFVLLFSAVLAIGDAAGLFSLGGEAVRALIAAVLEVSGGCVAAVHTGEAAPLILGFAIGFGGLSVQCQAAALLKDTGVIDRSFFAARVVQGALTALLTTLVWRWLPVRVTAAFAANTAPLAAVSAGSAGVSAALLLLCGIWMLTVGKKCDRIDITQ